MGEKRGLRKRIIVLRQAGPDAGDIIEEMLTRFGYQAVSVSGEAEALEVLKDDPQPHLLLIEASVENRKFASFLEGMRSDQELKGMPVIALVKEDDLGMATDILDAGCDAFLLKPIDPRVLYQNVQKLLEETPRAYNRVLCRIPAEAASGRETQNGEIVEIGEGGAGVLLGREQAERDILKLVFTFPLDQAEMTVGVEVVHVEKCGDQHLHGVRFIIIDGQAKEKIRHFVQAATLTGES